MISNYQSWDDVVSILYQNIWSDHESKVDIITKWINDIRSTENVSSKFVVEAVVEKFRKTVQS